MAQVVTDSVTVIRSAPATGSVIYIPEISADGGSYFPELRTFDTSKHQIVADIASSQHDDVRRVIAIDLANGKSWDASEEIATEVLKTVLTEYNFIPRWCIDFLEQHLGCWTVAEAQREAA